MKVLQLVASSHGGGAVHVRDLALGLPSDAYEVTVAMPEDGGNVSGADFQEAGIGFEPVDIAAGISWGRLGQLRRLVGDGRFDIVHVHGARAALFGRLAATSLRRRPRLVFSVHGFATPFHPQPKRALYLLLERALQRVTDVTVCVAEAEAELFLSFGLTGRERVRVVPYGIRVNRFVSPDHEPDPPPCGWSRPDGPIILTVCRLNVPRDFDSLLAALAMVIQRFRQARLCVVGVGPLRPQVEALIGGHGLARHVCMAGMRDDVPALMQMADVYVLTSCGWEGYPISTLEAQAAGVPVVVTDAGGSREAVLHQATGLLVPKSDPEALAEALMALLSDDALRRKLGAAGQERARRDFDLTRMVTRLSDIYRTLS